MLHSKYELLAFTRVVRPRHTARLGHLLLLVGTLVTNAQARAKPLRFMGPARAHV